MSSVNPRPARDRSDRDNLKIFWVVMKNLSDKHKYNDHHMLISVNTSPSFRHNWSILFTLHKGHEQSGDSEILLTLLSD